jgi:hypothetical protein
VRAFLAILLSLMLQGTGLSDPVLPPHTENHPSLFFHESEIPDLLSDIASDPLRTSTFSGILSRVENYATMGPDSLVLDYWGYRQVAELSLAARLGSAETASTASETLEELALYLCDNWGPSDLDSFLGELSPALRLWNLSWAYDHGFRSASDSLRQRLVSEMLESMEVLSSDSLFTKFQFNPLVSNKGITIGASLLLAGMALGEDLPGDPVVAQAKQAGRVYIKRGIEDLLPADGTYREGISYLVWTMMTLLPAWEASWRLEGTAEWEEEHLQRVLEWMAWQILPVGEGKFLNRNDSSTLAFETSRHVSLLEWASGRLAEPGLAAWLLRHTSGAEGHNLGEDSDTWATVLWHQNPPELDPRLLGRDRFFPDRGFYVYRQAWPGDPLEDSFLMTLEGGQFMGGHMQEDVGQFTLRAMGHGFAIDHGYGDTDTKAHNLPTIDDRGQHNAGKSIGTDGVMSFLWDSDFLKYLKVDMAQAYTTHSAFNDPDVPWEGWDWSWGYDGGNPMQVAERSLLLFPGEEGELPEIYLRDDLLSEIGGDRALRWRMHLEEDLQVQLTGVDTWEIAGDNGSLHLYAHEPAFVDGAWGLSSWDNGNVDPESQVFRFYRSEERNRVLMHLAPVPLNTEAPRDTTFRFAGGILATSERGNRSRRILLRKDEEWVEGAGSYSDGLWAGVELQSGMRTASFLFEGSRYLDQGRTMVQLDRPSSVTWQGETVLLGDDNLDFLIWAPDATEVLCNGVSQPFVRNGDYVTNRKDSDPDPVPVLAGVEMGEPRSSDGRTWIFPLIPHRDVSVVARIYDIRGRRLETLHEGSLTSPRDLVWDSSNLSRGVYLFRLSAPGVEIRRKILTPLSN